MIWKRLQCSSDSVLLSELYERRFTHKFLWIRVACAHTKCKCRCCGGRTCIGSSCIEAVASRGSCFASRFASSFGGDCIKVASGWRSRRCQTLATDAGASRQSAVASICHQSYQLRVSCEICWYLCKGDTSSWDKKPLCSCTMFAYRRPQHSSADEDRAS